MQHFICTLLVVAAVVVAGAKPKAHQLAGYTFEQYLRDFRVSFPESELESRKALFEKELARVQQHNANSGATWKEGVNKFSAWTASEKSALNGRSKGKAAAQHKQNMLKNAKALPSNFKMKALGDLPKSVDWRESGVVTAVKDQGHCGSCWSFGSTATMESHIALETGLLFDLSTQQVAMCAPNPDHCGGIGGCEGSTAELAFEYVTGSSGLYQEYQYGYTSYYGTDYECSLPPALQTSPVATIDGYVKLNNNDYEAVMNAVAQVGPLAINVDASTWHAYESGIFSGCDQKTPDINHVVVLVGYGEEEDGTKYWLVRNSWSPSYGEQGYIRVLREDPSEQVCGMDVTPTDGVECEGSDEPVTVCGTCGVIYDVSYPLNPRLL